MNRSSANEAPFALTPEERFNAIELRNGLLRFKATLQQRIATAVAGLAVVVVALAWVAAGYPWIVPIGVLALAAIALDGRARVEATTSALRVRHGLRTRTIPLSAIEEVRTDQQPDWWWERVYPRPTGTPVRWICPTVTTAGGEVVPLRALGSPANPGFDATADIRAAALDRWIRSARARPD